MEAQREARMSASGRLPTDIYGAAARGELQKVDKWLREGGHVDALCKDELQGRTLSVGMLHVAATAGHLEVVKELLKRRATIDLPDHLGCTPLIGAAQSGHQATLDLLLKHSADPDLQCNDGGTTLMMTGFAGHVGCVQVLLEQKANTELRDKGGHTAVQYAEARGHKAVVGLIQQHATSLAAQPPALSQRPAASPATPEHDGEITSASAALPKEMLDAAGKKEQPALVAKWLSEGGDVDALYTWEARGKTRTAALLHAATTFGRLDMVKELLERGASVNLPNNIGHTSLMDAALYGYDVVLLTLLEHSADPDKQNHDGGTALMATAINGRKKCAEALLRAGANTELRLKSGSNALETAEGNGHTAIVELIRQHTADAAMKQLLAEEEAEQAKEQARSKKSKKKKKKAGGGETSHAPPQIEPVTSATEEVLLQAGGGLAVLETASVAAPCDVQVGGVGVEARVEWDRLLCEQQRTEQQRTEHTAEQEAMDDAATLMPAKGAEQKQESAAAVQTARAAAAIGWLMEAEGAAALRAAVNAAEPLKGEFPAVAEALEATVERLQLADEEEKAVAEARRIPGPDDMIEATQVEQASAEGSRTDGGAGPSGARGLEAEVPDEYFCPITSEIMVDPVSTVDGFTYERSAIEQWLKKHDTSPTTGATLELKFLIPNHSVRSMIRAFQEAQDSPGTAPG